MLASALSWLGAALILIGGLFCLIGVVGLLRFPDLLTRMHGVGVVDSLGAGLVLLGLILTAGWSLAALKLIFILILIEVTAVTAAHALARAAIHAGEGPNLAVYSQKMEPDA